MRIAVFLGSSAGTEAHRAATIAVAEGLVDAGHSLVYGGARVGLMGLLADTALAAGGEVHGVIPQHLVDREVAHDGLSALDVVGSMHERKARMAELADAFVALPGGAGTLEELFEIYTWSMLGLHAKPIALWDPDDYWTPLEEQLDRAVADGYLGTGPRAALTRLSDVPSLLAWCDRA
ncbi:TIGR00730 family Rossman fold protein [Nocardioides flavescens]|uniref:Cytokinin riboside 5'-monophosphate phosphoribohydrolase n=1 Tax=Nocardioides flavescens TaxID=2691959 RepID=A0A6L7F0P0_9ACTN|nr:TIGR00730 family Rossman fold protein [Nocardioides flavescens]